MNAPRSTAIVRRIGIPACLSLLAALAHAQTLTASVTMDGAQEAPAVVSAATATATVTVDTQTRAVSVSGSYSGFTTNQTLAHIHQGVIGVSGGIVVGLTGTGGTSGTFSGSGVFTPTQSSQLLHGGLYLNLHTVSHSGGEIRGQIENLRAPAELVSDPVVLDTGGNPLRGPKINDAVETLNVSLDCSQAGAPGLYTIQIHPGTIAPPLSLPGLGSLWFSGPKLVVSNGSHSQNVVSLAGGSGFVLPNTTALIGFSYTVQGFCFDPSNPPGRLSTALIQVIR